MKNISAALLYTLALSILTPCIQNVVLGQSYTIADLGTPDDSYSEAHGLNNSNGVVGEFELTNSFSVSAFWYRDGTRTNIGTLTGNPYAVAWGINETNAIVGESAVGVDTHAFVYSNGVMTDLGTLGGSFVGGYSSAHAINRSGQIVGESSTSFMLASTIHAVLYSGGTKTDLGALGGDYSSANGVNSSGIIVGESDVVEQGVTNVHAFVYTNNPMKDLGTLGGTYSSANGINDSSVIVGESETVIGGVSNLHAFIYQNGVMSDLGTLGGSASSASAVNSSGQIVGYATDASDVSCAFLYIGSTMLRLIDHIPAASGWTNLTSADAINDAGQIAGTGFLANGSFHAYLLTPAGQLIVGITNPAANATFAAPATFVVGAFTTDSAGSVTNVQFLVNGSVIGNSTSAPYSATANSLSAGSYRLTAVASDDTGLKATNSINVTVTSSSPSRPTILNPTFDGAGFSFSFSTETGYTYEGQFTTPLASSNNWLTFTNLTGDGSTVRVTNSTPTNTQRYYRVVAH